MTFNPPARSADDYIAVVQATRLELEVLAAYDETCGEVVVFPHLLQGLENLVGELSGWSDHQSTHTVLVRISLVYSRFIFVVTTSEG